MRGLQHYISLHAFIIIEHDPIISVEWKALRHIGQTSENTINLIVYAWLSGQLIELYVIYFLLLVLIYAIAWEKETFWQRFLTPFLEPLTTILLLSNLHEIDFLIHSFGLSSPVSAMWVKEVPQSGKFRFILSQITYIYF